MERVEFNPIVSVIVPVYNVSEYLPYCLDSILEQSYRELEIILVDDGSTDDSGKICDEYAKKDERIKVLHQQNGGLSAARNAGLGIATGEFVTFIDSDDFIHRDFVFIQMEQIKRSGAQASICSYVDVYENVEHSSALDLKDEDVEVLDNRACVKASYDRKYKGITGTACWKIYKKSLFPDNNIEYPVGRINEDIYTTYKLLYFAEKTVYVDLSMYYYRKRKGSIMQTSFESFSERNMLVLDATKEAIEFYLERGERELAALAINYHIRLSFGLNHKMKQSKAIAVESKKKYLSEMKQSVNKYLDLHYLSRTKQIVYRLVAAVPIDYLLGKVGV